MARAVDAGVQAYLWGRAFVEYWGTTLAGLAARASCINSWRESADVRAAADRCVVALNCVSIDACCLVEVSVKPVMISVPALSCAR